MRRAGPGHEFELEVLSGLLDRARDELARLGYPGSRPLSRETASFRAEGPLRRISSRLARARLAVAFHLVLTFDVPRPRALLGDEHSRRLLDAIDAVRASGGHSGFRFSAAGTDSTVFRRLADLIERHTGLGESPDGELLIRVRRQRSGAWQVLLRLFPRPLSARSWRHCNAEGGLNATIAAAMNDMLLQEPPPADPVYLNAMCGTGTLLAEWCSRVPHGQAAGFDLNGSILACAADNLRHCRSAPELFTADATAVPRPDSSCHFITCDPPWGDDIGTHETNAQLYPAFLREARRLLLPGGLLVMVSHELKLLQRVLQDGTGFTVREELRVWHGGHHPGIWLLEKR